MVKPRKRSWKPLKAKDVKALSDGELVKQLDEKGRELMDLRFKAATRQIKNHREIPVLRKDIARIKTEKRQRELGLSQG